MRVDCGMTRVVREYNEDVFAFEKEMDCLYMAGITPYHVLSVIERYGMAFETTPLFDREGEVWPFSKHFFVHPTNALPFVGGEETDNLAIIKRELPPNVRRKEITDMFSIYTSEHAIADGLVIPKFDLAYRAFFLIDETDAITQDTIVRVTPIIGR
jgi:hypothetical protein